MFEWEDRDTRSDGQNQERSSLGRSAHLLFWDHCGPCAPDTYARSDIQKYMRAITSTGTMKTCLFASGGKTEDVDCSVCDGLLWESRVATRKPLSKEIEMPARLGPAVRPLLDLQRCGQRRSFVVRPLSIAHVRCVF